MLTALTLLSALGCGLVAGIFFAFSSFIMQALARLPPAHGIAAMQSINVAVINPLFLTVFLGAAVACICAAIAALLRDAAGAGFVLAGAVLYVIGTLLVTMRCNVPRNDRLARVDPESVEGATAWAGYLPSWTRWNHVRTAAASAASVMLIVAFALQWHG
ncbi:MAG: DUF1772 domain-containing protein [Luteimonas sp.]|nr:DUF1772 domain-containing protein [Luteimonas sp.]